MKTRSDTPARSELLQGTLEMLILKTLTHGPNHGYGVAQKIEVLTQDVLKIEEGSLYPALHRLAKRGMIAAEWGLSENNRRAKYYTLTTAGKRQLEVETSSWERFATAISNIMHPAT